VRRRLLIGSLVMLIALAGVAVTLLLLPREAVALRTGSTGCYLSFIEGQLVEETENGMVVLEVDGHVLIWPATYTAHRWLGKVEVFDRRGGFVARTGDQVHFNGGYDDAEHWLVCGLEMLD
jgi:hypothetical protein